MLLFLPLLAPVPPVAAGHCGTDQRLQDGMVGGIHTGVQWKSTLPLTVIGRVALRGDDPVLWVGKGGTINVFFHRPSA